MTAKYDDSDSSWEFVGKDSSDSEDDGVMLGGRVRHDTGIPEHLIHDEEEVAQMIEVAMTETDSDIEVCIQDDVFNNEEKPIVDEEEQVFASEVPVKAAPATATTEIKTNCDIIEAESESDVEKIAEETSEASSVNNDVVGSLDAILTEADEHEEVTSSGTSICESSLSSDDSKTSVKYLGFNIIDNVPNRVEEVMVEVDGAVTSSSESESEIFLSDKTSQTSTISPSTSSVSCGTPHLYAKSIACGTIRQPPSLNHIIISGIVLTALGIGFSIGAMYGPLHAVVSHTRGHAVYVNPGRTTVGENIHNSDAATPPPTLDATIDLKTRLKQRTLSVNALKGRISKLRLENERLKTNIKMATNKNMRGSHMQNFYKNMALHQQFISSQLERKLQIAEEIQKRRTEDYQHKLDKVIRDVQHYRDLYKDSTKVNSTLQAVAVETLYQIMQNKTNEIFHLRHELVQLSLQNSLDNASFMQHELELQNKLSSYKQEITKLQLLIIEMANQNKKTEKSVSETPQEIPVADNSQNIESFASFYHEPKEVPYCTIVSPLPDTQNTDTNMQTPTTLILNLTAPQYDFFATNTIPEKSYEHPDYAALRRLFLNIVLSKESPEQEVKPMVSYVPSVYYDHALHMQGKCRMDMSKARRDAYILLLKNKYAMTQISHQEKESLDVKKQLSVAHQTISELQQQNDKQSREKSSQQCQAPTMQQCLKLIVNTTALQPYLNVTAVKQTFETFATELNQTALSIWDKIIKLARKQQTKEEKTKQKEEKLNQKEKQKKWWKVNKGKKQKNKDKHFRTKRGAAKMENDKPEGEGADHGKWWKKNKKSHRVFKNLQRKVQDAVHKGGSKIAKAFSAVKSKVSDGSQKLKKKAEKLYNRHSDKPQKYLGKVQKFYDKHSDKPKKYFEKAKDIGGLVFDKLVNATKTIVTPSKQETIYCHSKRSSKGCSHNIEKDQDVDNFEFDNKNTDLWYIKRYEQREQKRNTNEETCESDWFTKRQQVREILREEENKKREYEESIRNHIKVAKKSEKKKSYDHEEEDEGFYEDDDDFVDNFIGKTQDVLDDMVYFNFQKNEEENYFIFPNF